jgi:hypothetical protein
MTSAERTITFRARELKGSRLRCLLLTGDAPNKVASFLNALVTANVLVTAKDRWAPRGFLEPNEAKLGETPGFLPEPQRDALTRWWLARLGSANTPNWDLVSTCLVTNRTGLVLIEAKAHEAEFRDDRCGATNQENLQQIEHALGDATVGWNALAPGFALPANSRYQLSNRFAVACKLAKMGIPVVLLYLGFLDAQETAGGNRVLLKDHAQWRRCVLARSKGTIPEHAWDRAFDVEGTPLIVLIRSAVVGIHARPASVGPAA